MTDHEQENYEVPSPEEADLDNEVSRAMAAAQAEINVEREPDDPYEYPL